jgi:hypothetical protein
MRKTVTTTVLVAAIALMTTPVGATSDGPRPFADDSATPIETDAIPATFDPRSSPTEAATGGFEFNGDPLELVVWPRDMRRYSLGEDRIGVYVCTWAGATGGASLPGATAALNTEVNPYFDGLSGGLYDPLFISRTTVTVSPNSFTDCADKMAAAANPLWDDNAAIGILDNAFNAGQGGPGFHCSNCAVLSDTTFPGNGRWAVVDGGAVKAGIWGPAHITTAAHEIGHTISFPHSYSGEVIGFDGDGNPLIDEYDNPIDFMSGNRAASLITRADNPYGSLAFNRYRAGWLDPSDVVFYRGGISEITLAPLGVEGTQMVILPTGYEYSFVALDARLNSALDPIPESFEGISAHYIEQWCEFVNPIAEIPYIDECGGLSSRPYSYPPSPDSIDHVTSVGDEAKFDVDQGEELLAQGAKLEVLAETADGLVIKLIGFDDFADSIFVDDILWLAESGITTGCTETSFCPKKSVTRGQMAAFLVRALGYTDAGSGNLFIDDDDTIFENDIDKLAIAGVTRGCNPPLNDNFCPGRSVTREQMAAFLVRALGLTDDGGGNSFIDDDGSVFEDDIAKLAASGITTGCNPPDNDMFCPKKAVTREQMAAFLRRALG